MSHPLTAQHDSDSLTAVALQSLTTTNSQAPLASPDAPEQIPSSIAPATAQSTTLINLDDFRADPRFAGIDGSGVAVVVLDTGIDLDDPFFGPDNDNDNVADRIVHHHDFADNDGNATDVNGHGSNVTSIVASSDAVHTGMAPGVDIIHLKVFKNNGSGNFGYVESALKWVVANAETYNIVSVNMSLGDSANHNSTKKLYGISDEINALRNTLGVSVVSASGNLFFNYGSVQGVSYPAADANSLSIGAVYDSDFGPYNYGLANAFSTGPDHITPFSQRHQTLTPLFAPGAEIVGAGPGDALTTQHGTSQATPHIAGIVALMQQLALQELDRLLTSDEIDSILVTTGVVINDGDDEDDNVTNTSLNFRRVDMLAIGEAILDMIPETVPPVVTAVNSDEDSGDGELTDGEMTNASITELMVIFNEGMNNPSGHAAADDVTNPSNYLLVEAGPNGSFNTAFCGSPAGDDTAVTINSVSYSATNKASTLNLNGGSPVGEGAYRLFACDTLEDNSGNRLDGDSNSVAGTDFMTQFTVDQTGPEISLVGIDGDADASNGILIEPIRQLSITFSEAMNNPSGDSEANDVTNPALYALIGAGANGVLDTAVCGTLQSDDVAVSVNSINYNDTNHKATINVNGGSNLDASNYRFELCGSGVLTDDAGNYLNDGEADFSFTFEVLMPESYDLFLPLITK
ncbi:MAG: S8 family serine peptidase [Chloroflexota bacterium]